MVNYSVASRRTLICIALLLCSPAKADCTSPSELQKLLGWVNDPSYPSLCHGYYTPWDLFPATTARTDDHYHWNANEVTYSLSGLLSFKGHFELTRLDQQMTADSVQIYVDKKTAKPKEIIAENHVKFTEKNRWLAAQKASVDLVHKTVTLYQVIYRALLDNFIPTQKTSLAAWGKATEAKKNEDGTLDLQNATYSTCPPNHCAWKLSGKRFHLNKVTGRGEAYHSVLRVQNIPVFYWPYINFPIDKRRQSGFLFPYVDYSSRTGTTFALPYYWNLAPNYDATITPYLMSKRGIWTTLLYRYLTQSSQGNVTLGFIPSDAAFRRFQEEAKNNYHGNPLLDRLESASPRRYLLDWQNHSQWNPHWSTDIHATHVSDDYYFEDFSHGLDSSTNQLLQQVKLNYASDFWNFSTNFQDYQTLHPIDQATIANTYARLPQIQLSAKWPKAMGGFEYSMKAEDNQFFQSPNPETPTVHPVEGNRFSFRPAISYPMQNSYSYFIPTLQWQFTQYALQHQEANTPKDHEINVPIVSVKTGLYFDRTIQWFHESFQQTLEPILYYLYVPYRNQENIPNFDTVPQLFNYDSLFLDNRFSSMDKIGDTNQITVGMGSRLINSKTGEQKASFSIGQTHYFTNRRVMFDHHIPSDPNNETRTSPVAAMLTYNFNRHWSLNGNTSWSPYTRHFENQNVGVQYLLDQNHLINVSYNAIHDFPSFNPSTETWDSYTRLQQLDVSGFWKLTDHWSLMGRWNYNLKYGHRAAYLMGAGYENCCWAVRILGARVFKGVSTDQQNQFNNSIYFEFALKGLGNVGNHAMQQTLTDSINGYVDNFGQGH